MNLLETYNYIECQSDKEYLHKYISHFYENHIGDKKYEKIAMLEIGIQYGHSLKLWDTYFENAKIYGMDIANQLKVNFTDKVTTLFFNAYSLNALEYINNLDIKFDIIIDDGPHTIETQNFICKNYKQFLNKNGIMVIEDVHLNNYQILHSNNKEFKVLNLLDIAPAYGDSIIMFHKEEN